MGGTVSPLSRTPAEQTAVYLQLAAQRGSPVMIPGAWETRPSHPAPRPQLGTAPLQVPDGGAIIASDRDQLEHEREGGGAPSERVGGRRSAMLWSRLLAYLR
jgi:hypothetical protein